MFKYSIKLKEHELDCNPTVESMRKDYAKLVQDIKKGKQIKVSYGLDQNGEVVKIAITMNNTRENEMAEKFLYGDGVVTTEPLHDANVPNLMEDIKRIINIAAKNERSKNMKNADKVMKSNTVAALENKEEISEVVSAEMGKEEMSKDPAVEKAESSTADESSEAKKKEIKGDLSLATDLVVDCDHVAPVRTREEDDTVDITSEAREVKTEVNIDRKSVSDLLEPETDINVGVVTAAGVEIKDAVNVDVVSTGAGEAIEDMIPVVNDAVAEPVAESQNQKDNLKESDVDLRKKAAKAEALKEFNRLGGIMLNDSSAVLAVGETYKNTLTVELVVDKESGKRLYEILETHDNQKQGVYSKAGIFKASDIRKKKSCLEDHIIDIQDDYSDRINNILTELEIIETNRLLKITPSTKRTNIGVATTQEIIEELKKFMLDNPLDERLFSVEIAGEKHVGIVGRGTNTSYKNFRRLMEEIAPENSAKSIKDEMKNKKMFKTDKNDKCFDCQHSVPVEKRFDIIGEIRADKMYSLDLGDDFAKRFEEARKKAMGKSVSKEAQKSQVNHGGKTA